MEENNSRRKFIQQSALLAAGIILGSSTELLYDHVSQSVPKLDEFFKKNLK